MRFGVIFPQTEIGIDPTVIRDYAQAAESLGYEHLIAYDHVLGANPASRPGWRPPYTHKDIFHELFVLFGYLVGMTKRIGLTAGVVILPQRQTALVAKQAAAVAPHGQSPWHPLRRPSTCFALLGTTPSQGARPETVARVEGSTY